MKIALKIVKWVAGSLLGFIIIVGLCWWLIPDEDLNPEADKFAAIAPAPPAANNAYFMIWGLVASPELDPHAVGQQIVAAHDRILASEKDLSKFKPDAFYGDRPLRFPKDSKPFCDVEKENCLLVYQAKQAELEAESLDKKVYLARYRKIREYEDYGTAMSAMNYQTPVPAWNPLLRVSDLVDGDIAVRMATKDTQKAALEELAADVHSWRRLLQSNDWLITQMISVVALHRKYRLASEIMNVYPEVVTTFPAIIEKITTPLLPRETNVASSMRAEAQFNLGTMRDMKQGGKFLADSFFEGMPGSPLRMAMYLGGFRVNATINRAYVFFKEWVELFAKSPKAILEEKNALLDRQAKSQEFTVGAVFYNPIGRFLETKGNYDMASYAFRIADLIGLSRLVDTQRRIIAGKVPMENVGSALANIGPGLMDPYTEKPMQWDAASKRVSFVLHGKRFANYGYVTLDHLK
ncbi:MAG: hypothetical protein LH481_17480 [Burkholderiales bacterium]|nr:hypothetical protein [Burkholderiales bacterium]